VSTDEDRVIEFYTLRDYKILQNVTAGRTVPKRQWRRCHKSFFSGD